MKSDKKAHFICGLIISFIVTITFYNPSVGFLVGGLFALAKEIRDEIVYSGFDYKDLLITVLGSWLGSALGFGFLIYYSLRQ
jgi:hypothetical protein